MRMSPRVKAKLDEFIKLRKENPDATRYSLVEKVGIGAGTLHFYKDYVNKALGENTVPPKRPYKRRAISSEVIRVPIEPKEGKMTLVMGTPSELAAFLREGV